MLTLDISARAGDFDLQVKLDALDGTTLIVGPNGSGKSSLLKCILGVMKPSSGSIRVGEHVLFDAKSGISVPIEERRIGYVPQSYALFPHMTARENVEFGLRPGSSRDIGELMEHLDVARVADRKAAVLSGGESQRVALARALAPEPRLLLLDEPMAALDQTARKRVRGFIAEILGELDIPAVVVSHEREDVFALGQRVAVIEQGRIVQVGSCDEIASSPATEFVHDLFASEPSQGV